MNSVNLFLGDCRDVLKEIEDESVDAIITDPPYGISFMGTEWDNEVPPSDIWVECKRVLKPGGYLLSFAATRTQHRMATYIEDAGFEIRDVISWIYSNGFAKSQNVGQKARERNPVLSDEFDGVWSALKGSVEPIIMARKPFKGSLTKNIADHGTGGIFLNRSRVPIADPQLAKKYESVASSTAHEKSRPNSIYGSDKRPRSQSTNVPNQKGRFPSNVIWDGSDEISAMFPARIDMGPRQPKASAARFYYCATASATDRGEYNNHKTVKPTELMRYLCGLVTPEGGVILDPFCGSGSTGKAAVLAGYQFIGIEREPEYFEIAKRRIEQETSDL